MNDAAAVVFVVDDDRSMRESLQMVMRSVDLRALAFASPQEFLAAARPDAPGCLILDVRMPGSSGLDLQQQLVDARIDIAIIFLTGHADVRVSVRAMKAGAVEFLTSRSAIRNCWTRFTRPSHAAERHERLVQNAQIFNTDTNRSRCGSARCCISWRAAS